jgi:hypothetical protein
MIDQLEQDLIILNLEEIQGFRKIIGNAKFYLTRHTGGACAMVWHPLLNSTQGWDYAPYQPGFDGWKGWNIVNAKQLNLWFKETLNGRTLKLIEKRIEQITGNSTR